jgi:hypothetical protein
MVKPPAPSFLSREFGRTLDAVLYFIFYDSGFVQETRAD